MMYDQLNQINSRPKPFEVYTAEQLWTDEYTSQQMLQYHLNPHVDLSSRRHAFIERSVNWMIAQFDITAQTTIADFGCGPGLYTTPLAQTGADVTGVDFSKRSIEYARNTAAEKGLDITYINDNYLNFETDRRFDLILMIMCDFCALSPSQRQTLLRRFHTLLKPSGAILFDAYTLTAFEQKQETAIYERNQLNGFWAPGDYYGFVNSFKYEHEKVTLDKYTIIEPHRTRTIYNWLQYFSRESLTDELAQNGLKVRRIFGDVAGSDHTPQSTEMAVIAAKS